MTLTEARELRDEIRAKGQRAAVPIGYAPQAYFVRVPFKPGQNPLQSEGGPVDFVSREDFDGWRHAAKAAYNASLREFMQRAGIAPQRPLSPIERMVDAACGYKG